MSNPILKRRQLLHAVAVVALIAALPATAQTDYPNRPIRIVIPLPAGGAADVMVRAIALELGNSLKQPLIVDNKPGGLFQIGVQAVAAAPADGYTVLYIYNGMVTAQAVQKQYDLTRQFRPITLGWHSPTALAVGPNSKFNSIEELVKYGRANPGKLTYSTLGPGSIEHLKTYQFTKTAGFEALAVPYKGGPDAVRGLMGSEVDFIITPASLASQYAPKGLLKVLAAMDSARIKGFQDVPTMVEAGANVPPFRFWSGFLLPAQTPTAIVQRLHKAFISALTSASVGERLNSVGSVVNYSNQPEEFGKYIAAEAAWMGDLAKELKLETN